MILAAEYIPSPLRLMLVTRSSMLRLSVDLQAHRLIQRGTGARFTAATMFTVPYAVVWPAVRPPSWQCGRLPGGSLQWPIVWIIVVVCSRLNPASLPAASSLTPATPPSRRAWRRRASFPQARRPSCRPNRPFSVVPSLPTPARPPSRRAWRWRASLPAVRRPSRRRHRPHRSHRELLV